MPDTRSRRVLEVLRTARRFVDPVDPLGALARRELPRETHLSPAGVALALEHHLERSVSHEDLLALLASVEVAPRVHVVLSSNVFVAAVRAIALATASAPQVFVRPSRRAPWFATQLVEALDASLQISLVDALDPLPGDVVHGYGHDSTLDALRSALGPTFPLWGHGAGLGVALLDSEGSLDLAAERLAQDIIPFDQRGCLSPRVVVTLGELSRGEQCAQALASALERWGEKVPLGAMSDAERADRRRFLDTSAALGRAWEADSFAIALTDSSVSPLLCDAPRCVHVLSVPNEREFMSTLTPLTPWITCVGGSPRLLKERATELFPLARKAQLGEMQRPPLDGPVDLRTPHPRLNREPVL